MLEDNKSDILTLGIRVSNAKALSLAIDTAIKNMWPKVHVETLLSMRAGLEAAIHDYELVQSARENHANASKSDS